MRFVKKVSAVLLCLIMIFSLAFSVSAEDREIEITVGSATAIPGDEIAISLDTVKNTGVMAMTFTLSYDPEVLEYKSFNLGMFNDYTVADHPDKGYVSFVNCEKRDEKFVGNIAVFLFKVKPKAKPGKHELKIGHIHPDEFKDTLDGCFATWDKLKVNATTHAGSVTVGKTCSNMGHSFGKWETVSKPGCENVGVESRSCKACGHTENRETKALGHDFSMEWTIDVAATASESGTMSRHCSRCSKTTDSVLFSLEVPKDNKFENKVDAVVPAEKWDKLEEKVEENTAFPDAVPDQETEVNTVESEADVKEENEPQKTENKQKLDKKTTLILMAAAGVLLLAVIVIILIVLRRK